MRRVCLVFLLASPACDDHMLGDGGPAVSLNCLRDPPLTYENTGKGLLDSKCTSCHSKFSRAGQRVGAPEGIDFDTWEDVLTWAERIDVRTVVDETMPPAGGMLPDERTKMGEWLRCEVYPALGQFDDGEEDES